MKNQRELTEYLVRSGILKTQNIVDAFYNIDRANFASKTNKEDAYYDSALAIGYGQTISQPTVVAFMLELLQPKAGERILDIGSGSAWTTALLAKCVGRTGEVYGVEIVPELVEYGQKNLAKYSLPQARVLQAKKEVLGLPKNQPFDKILISAAADSFPRIQLESQFKEKLVMPINNSIWLFEKEDGKISETEYPGFFFVPLLI
jgi:protein-L-isoaspartate(D-aspartate) O-methyltransferase